MHSNVPSNQGTLPVADRSARVLRLPEVMTRVGLSRSTIYLRMNQGTFPKAISLGARACGWVESEIDAWLKFRMQARQTWRR
jgi:prophage regulatory protein